MVYNNIVWYVMARGSAPPWPGFPWVRLVDQYSLAQIYQYKCNMLINITAFCWSVQMQFVDHYMRPRELPHRGLQGFHAEAPRASTSRLPGLPVEASGAPTSRLPGLRLQGFHVEASRASAQELPGCGRSESCNMFPASWYYPQSNLHDKIRIAAGRCGHSQTPRRTRKLARGKRKLARGTVR